MKEFQYDPTHSKIQYVSKFVPALLEDNCFKIVYWPYIFLRGTLLVECSFAKLEAIIKF